MTNVILALLALASGVAITLQAQFMGLMDRAMGTKESVVITYGSGGLLVVLLAAATGGVRLKPPGIVPWYAYTTGLLGLVIVGTVGYVVPRMGAARGLTLVLASQFLLAALIDQGGLFSATVRPLDATRLVGLGIMLTGVWLVVR